MPRSRSMTRMRFLAGTFAFAAGVMLSSESLVVAASDGVALNTSQSSAKEEGIDVLKDRCLSLARSPHWTDAGFIGAPAAHRFGMERLCNLAVQMLNDDAGARGPNEAGLTGEIFALPAADRPSAFSSACRKEADSGPRSLAALNWRNSPHRSAKMALCDQFERALVAAYFEAQLH